MLHFVTVINYHSSDSHSSNSHSMFCIICMHELGDIETNEITEMKPEYVSIY